MNKPNVHAHPALMEYMAEECECANMYLDDRQVPKQDAEGRGYSLVGTYRRI